MRAAQGRNALPVASLAIIGLFTGTILAEEPDVASPPSATISADSREGQGPSKGADMGTGNFSRFPFQISASVNSGYDDNVTTSNVNRQESWFTSGSVALTYNFGSPRTQLSLQTGGGATYYWDRVSNFGSGNQDYDVNLYLGLTLHHKASPRLSFDLKTFGSYQTEPDFLYGFGLDRRSGNFFYTQDQFTVNYLWTPRFSTATSYTLGAVHYDDLAFGLFEDRVENTFGNQFKFLLWPTTSLVAEYRLELVNYTNEGDPIGPTVMINGQAVTPELDRDSITQFILAGFDHSFNPRFNISFRGGAEFRDYPDAITDEQQSAPYFEGTLNYTVSKLTSLSWTNRYAIEEADVLQNPNRKTFRSGLRATHNLTPRLAGNLAAFYEHDDYESVNTLTVVAPSFIEQAIDLSLSLRFAVNRYFGVEAGYGYTDVWSDIAVREYSRNRYWAGLNVTF